MKLSRRICIYVPSTFEGNKPAKRMQRRATKKAAARLSVLFGGCTTTQAVGYWMSDTKGLIAENQTLVYSNTTEEGKAAHLDTVKAFARALCRYMRQEAVTLEVDGELEFIEA